MLLKFRIDLPEHGNRLRMPYSTFSYSTWVVSRLTPRSLSFSSLSASFHLPRQSHSMMPGFASVRAPLALFSVSVFPPLIVSINGLTCPVLMCQWFAPSRLVITLERDGQGAFSMDEIREIAVRGRDGRVLGLKLPIKSVLIANHQVRNCPSN